MEDEKKNQIIECINNFLFHDNEANEDDLPYVHKTRAVSLVRREYAKFVFESIEDANQQPTVNGRNYSYFITNKETLSNREKEIDNTANCTRFDKLPEDWLFLHRWTPQQASCVSRITCKRTQTC